MILFRHGALALAAAGLAAGLLAFAEPGFRGQADAATNPVTLKVSTRL